MRLRTFSRRSRSMAARSRTSLSRVLHFAYLLQPMPIARSAEMIQTVISVEVTRGIKKQNVLATTQQLLSTGCPRIFHSRHVLRKRSEKSMRNYGAGLRRRLHRVITKNVFSRDRSIEASPGDQRSATSHRGAGEARRAAGARAFARCCAWLPRSC
jgi:hypothetical protein